ncbi:hypothetical protein ACP70R_028595 [Stipagrostis hirtigluma subsp. patula]
MGMGISRLPAVVLGPARLLASAVVAGAAMDEPVVGEVDLVAAAMETGATPKEATAAAALNAEVEQLRAKISTLGQCRRRLHFIPPHLLELRCPAKAREVVYLDEEDPEGQGRRALRVRGLRCLVTGSSHVGSKFTNNDIDGGAKEGESEDLGGTNMENNHCSSNLQWKSCSCMLVPMLHFQN